MPVYTMHDFAREMKANGIAGLSSEGRRYFNATLQEDFRRARQSYQDRLAARIAAEAAEADLTIAELVAALPPSDPAVRSVAPVMPEALSYSEREHQRAINADWQQYS